MDLYEHRLIMLFVCDLLQKRCGDAFFGVATWRRFVDHAPHRELCNRLSVLMGTLMLRDVREEA